MTLINSPWSFFLFLFLYLYILYIYFWLLVNNSEFLSLQKMLILLPLLGIFGNALVAEVEASLSLSLGFKAIKVSVESESEAAMKIFYECH